MGQVPVQTQQFQKYALIGSGRLARHLARYLELTGTPFATWSRRQRTPLPSALEGSTHVLLAISDSAIEDFVRAESEALRGRVVVHFSGALATPLAVGAHPLMSFGEQLYSLEEYERIPFVTEEGRPGFREVFPTLRNPSYAIPPEQKPLYHALCVLSGNFTVLLWEKFFGETGGRFGIPREALVPYLDRIAANIRAGGGALTGPLARRDLATIERNLDALEGDPYQRVYQAFVEAHLR